MNGRAAGELNGDGIVMLRQQLELLQSRQDIHDCLTRYCRGVDRLDRALVLSAYHPDAVDDHGSFVGGPEQFADWAFALHTSRQDVTQHVITNHTCELGGDVAHAETYYLFAAMNKTGTPFTMGGGRYVDRFERREGRWAIAVRKCVRDWTANPEHSNLTSEEQALLAGFDRPRRDKSDCSYQRPLLVDPARLGLWHEMYGEQPNGKTHVPIAR